MALHSQFEEINDLEIFVVSLDRTPLRYEFIKEQLDEEGLSYQKLSAADGYEVGIRNLYTGETFTGHQLRSEEKNFDFNFPYTITCNFTPQPLAVDGQQLDFLYIYNRYYSWDVPLNAGEIGCACSHKFLWQYMVDNEVPYALILEDDVVLAPGFKDDLYNTLENLPDWWGIIYLNLDPENSLTLVNQDNDYFDTIHLKSWFYGTYGYIINLKSAQVLLNGSVMMNNTIDVTIDKLIKQGELNVYKTKKALLEVKLDGSEITSMGRIRNGKN